LLYIYLCRGQVYKIPKMMHPPPLPPPAYVAQPNLTKLQTNIA
jgi:hypothetical protein